MDSKSVFIKIEENIESGTQNDGNEVSIKQEPCDPEFVNVGPEFLLDNGVVLKQEGRVSDPIDTENGVEDIIKEEEVKQVSFNPEIVSGVCDVNVEHEDQTEYPDPTEPIVCIEYQDSNGETAQCDEKSENSSPCKMVEPVDKPFNCEVCNARFACKRYLNRHKLRHAETKRFECNWCDVTFVHKSELTIHLQRHSGDKPYACGQCAAKFHTSSELSMHKRVHTGIKHYVCDQCDTKLSSRSSFTRHKRVHSGDKPYHCEFCDAKFITRSDLNVHVRRHVGHKPYDCDLCGAKFVLVCDRNAHRRRHIGDKRYSCKMCIAKFVRSGELSTHRKKYHSENAP